MSRRFRFLIIAFIITIIIAAIKIITMSAINHILIITNILENILIIISNYKQKFLS